MVQPVHQRFAGSCMMLMHRAAKQARFCGTAFLVHSDGYLLTSSSCVEPTEDLVAVAAYPGASFSPVTMEEVTPIPVEVVRRDTEHNIALLRFVPEMNISVPDHILGNAERSELGSTMVSLGYSYGHNRLHSLLVLQSTLSAKIETPAGQHLLLFDTLVHDGDRGGPLIDAHDARVIGITVAPFDPIEIRPDEHHKDVTVAPTLSYAVSIEYGIALLEAEGVTVV